MKQIEDFLKNHNLKSELMKNESFVNESRKLFESQGLEFSEKKLEEIIGDISNNLKSVEKMSKEQLENVVGGGAVVPTLSSEKDSPEKPLSKAAIAVEATMTIVGTLAGAVIGIPLGRKRKKKVEQALVDGEWETTKKYEKTTFISAVPVITGGIGSVLGFQLGKLIVEKSNM